MEIEIVTTKKKLTKSIVNQMKRATPDVIINCEILGHVVNVHKSGMVALLQHGGDYYYLNLDWTKCHSLWTRPSTHNNKRYTQQFRFKSDEICNQIWNEYEHVKDHALTKHIYI